MIPPADKPPTSGNQPTGGQTIAAAADPADWELQLLCWIAEFGRKNILQQCRGKYSQADIHSPQAAAWLGGKLAATPQRVTALRRQLQQLSVQPIWYPQLPETLRAIPDPPLALYGRGELSCLAQVGVAVVGARRCSATGAAFAQLLGERLAAAGLVVVSGLALGIDGAAHRGALASGQDQGVAGTTVAVLGSGIGNLYPRAHASLAREILNSGGLIVSEHSPTHPSYPSNFPERNRLISGLCQAVVVVEAGLRSGSLVTARLALEQGREVLAVPGSVVSPVSAGCHRLLKQGAGLVTEADDVFAALGMPELVATSSSERRYRGNKRRQAVAGGSQPPAGREVGAVGELPSAEAQVYALLQALPSSLDTLSSASGLAVPQLLAVLTRLELAGFVQRLPQGYIPTPR